MNKKEFLRDVNLLTLFSLNNLIVPEIQREYVWGNNPIVLESFLNDLKSKAQPCDHCHHVHSTLNVNVGFLYSYKPLYAKYETSQYLDEYLIDGQQRITTLFLLLLYRATIEGRLNDFIAICRADFSGVSMGFNYKVRALTQQFIEQLIEHAKNEGDKAIAFLESSRENDYPYWILKDFQSDPTISAMLKALRCIAKVFNEKDVLYYDFLIHNVHFWHFNTDITSQGEELYITMNSRGEQLSDNEMKRARTLPANKLEEWGKQWEAWQTLFWRNRENNHNADKGFNNFLSSIEGLETYVNNYAQLQSPEISIIQQYIEALKYVCNEKFETLIKDKCSDMYMDWFKDFKKELWKKINEDEIDWFIDNPHNGDEARKRYNNKGTSRNLSMLFWPWMRYYKLIQEKRQTINDLTLIRLIHFYYIRYKCYKRSTSTIEGIVKKVIADDGIKLSYADDKILDIEENENNDDNSRLFSKEEIRISELCNIKSTPEKVESFIWKLQELPYFIDGKDVGGNTILTFIDGEYSVVSDDNAIEDLSRLYDNIQHILKDKINGAGNIIVKQLLLFYKTTDKQLFWKRQSPWYYFNYETSLWKRIVRTSCFAKFYFENFRYVYVMDDSLNNLLEDKRQQFFAENPIIDSATLWSRRKLCILYDVILDGLWSEKYPNIFFDGLDEKGIFKDQNYLYRGHRYFRAESELLKLPDNWREILSEKYPQIQIIESNFDIEQL